MAQTLLAYLLLKMREILLVKLLRRQPARNRILGFSVAYFDLGMFLYLFKEIFIERVYEFRVLSTRPLIIDCGSNVGMSILFFKKLYPDARVLGFEPDPATFNLLSKNVQWNRLADVTLSNQAIMDVEGTIEF